MRQPLVRYCEGDIGPSRADLGARSARTLTNIRVAALFRCRGRDLIRDSCPPILMSAVHRSDANANTSLVPPGRGGPEPRRRGRPPTARRPRSRPWSPSSLSMKICSGRPELEISPGPAAAHEVGSRLEPRPRTHLIFGEHAFRKDASCRPPGRRRQMRFRIFQLTFFGPLNITKPQLRSPSSVCSRRFAHYAANDRQRPREMIRAVVGCARGLHVSRKSPC